MKKLILISIMLFMWIAAIFYFVWEQKSNSNDLHLYIENLALLDDYYRAELTLKQIEDKDNHNGEKLYPNFYAQAVNIELNKCIEREQKVKEIIYDLKNSIKK